MESSLWCASWDKKISFHVSPGKVKPIHLYAFVTLYICISSGYEDIKICFQLKTFYNASLTLFGIILLRYLLFYYQIWFRRIPECDRKLREDIDSLISSTWLSIP